MKKTIKYLQNGEYHYATVKDVGDIDLLKTSNKDDLVSAINEIIVNGVSGGDGISQDQLDKINTDILGVSADIAAKYSELQGKISDGDAMQASLRAQAIKDINGAIAAANAAIEEYKKANEEAVKATQADIDAQNDRIDRINEQADALRTDLATAQTDLTQTKTDLSNAKLDFGKVRKSVVDLENEVSTKLSNTDLDPLNQKIQSVESNVKQTKDELSQYVRHDEYDLTTGEVNKIKSNVQQLADRVETKVSRDTLNDDINEFVVKKANLLVQTRDWSIIDNVGWTFSNDGLIAIQAELYDHAHVLELHQTGVYAEQTVKGLHSGQSYTVSVSAKINDAASGVNITLVDNNKTLGIMRRVKTHDTDISTEYERYEYTLVAPSDTLVLRFIATGMASSNVLYLYKAKLEEGTKSYEWEMNVNDIYAKVEKNSATLTTYDDRITGVVTKQRDFGTWKEQAQSTLTQTAEGLELNNQKLKSVDGDVVDVIQSKIDASAEKLTSNYEKFTNQQVGMIVDEGTNQILNSAFTYYDLDSKDVKKRSYTFDSWQNISAKAMIKSINKVNWVHMAQSGLSDDNPISITSNTFPVKQGKVIVGVDVLTPNVRAIDNQKVLVLQFYDDNGTRVDYREVSLHDLGLDTIQSNVSKRGTYRVGIDRKDVTKMTVLARLPRNGEINFTNFFAKVSSLDNGDYQPNPADLQQQTIKQQTAIEQTADTIKLKADQTTVDTLDGTVKRQGTLIEQNAQHIQLKADGTTVTALSNKTDELSQLVSKHSASLEVTDKAITQQASEISSVTTIANGANIKIDNLSFGGRNLLNGTSDFNSTYWYASGTADIVQINGKTAVRGSSNWEGRRYKGTIQLEPNTDYTVSVYVRVNGGNGNGLNLGFYCNLDGTQQTLGNFNLGTLSTEWKRVSLKWHNDNHREMTVPRVEWYGDFSTGGGSGFTSELQLEKGSRPSDYSLSQNDLQRLASEDTASQISQYNTGTVQPIKGIANDALGKANNANDKIDGLRIGGRNLLKNSDTMDGWYRNQLWTKLSDTRKGCAIWQYTNGRWNGLSTWVYVEKGEIYTFSVDARLVDRDSVSANMYIEQNVDNEDSHNKATIRYEDSSYARHENTPNLSKEWNRYKVTFVATSNGYVRPRVETNDYATLQISRPKLEEGNVATEWQPSDLDIPDTIVTTVTEVSNASQIVKSSGVYTDINSVRTETTGKIDTVNSRVSDVSGKVDNVNDKIDNLKVGGRNLLNGSSTLKIVGSADSNASDGTWRLSNWGNSTPLQNVTNELPPVVGVTNAIKISPLTGVAQDKASLSKGTYTFSVWLKGTKGAKYHIEPFWNNTATYATSGERTLITSDWDRVSFTVDLRTDENVISTAYVYNHDKTNVLYMAAPQLEKGNKPSDYSLSQNDLQRLAHDDAASQINTFDTKNITPIKQTVTQYTNKTDELAGSVTHFMGAIGYDGTTFTDKFKTVVETAGGTKATYRALEGKIDGIVVGGKNLLDGTADFNSNYWYASNGSATLMDINGKKAVRSSGDWEGRRYNQTIQLEPDTDYTISVYVRVNDENGNGLHVGVYCNLDGVQQTLGNFNIDTLSTEWKRVSLKWHNDSYKKMTTFRIEWYGDFSTGGGSGFTSEPQLEKGNKPSDWGMSDNDIKQKVAEAKKAADDNATSLTEYKRTVEDTYAKSEDVFSSVTKEDFKNIMKNATFLKTADGFETTVKSRVRPMIGGGKNLARGTSDSWTGVSTQEFNGTTNFTKHVANVYLDDLNVGDKVTVQIIYQYSKLTATNAKCWLQGYGDVTGWTGGNFYGTPTTINMQTGTDLKSGSAKYTFDITADMKKNRYWDVTYRFDNVNQGTWFQWIKFKVEKGTVATPWTPAPEDLASEDYVNTHVSNAKSDLTELVNNKTKDISTIKQTADKVSISVGKMFGKADASSLDVDADGVKLKGKYINLDGNVTIAPGFQLKADYIKSGTLNTDNLIMKHPQGSTVTFTQDGFDIQKSDNREAFYTIGGDGIDFWRTTESEAMNDYPYHVRPGYAHLGSLVALDNRYTKSVRRVDKQQQGTQYNHVTNDNGIGVILDVTGGSDNFAILQKGAAYRYNENGKLNYNDTVNNSHFPLWEVNATGFGSITYPQSNYMRGRGIINYTNTYYYTDMIKGSEHIGSSGVNYQPTKRLGVIGDNGWGDFAITADNNNTMAVGAGSHNQNVWVNGFIFGSQDGADRIFGYDGSQWVDFVNKRTTRDNNDFTNHFASLHLWELQYSVLTHTSQLSKKTDIEPLDTKDFASKILSIDLYKYRYKTQDKNEKDNYGAIIDDVNEVKQYNLPQEFITTRDKGINDSHLITGLIATVQEQAKQIEQLSFRILELERGASING